MVGLLSEIMILVGFYWLGTLVFYKMRLIFQWLEQKVINFEGVLYGVGVVQVWTVLSVI